MPNMQSLLLCIHSIIFVYFYFEILSDICQTIIVTRSSFFAEYISLTPNPKLFRKKIFRLDLSLLMCNFCQAFQRVVFSSFVYKISNLVDIRNKGRERKDRMHRESTCSLLMIMPKITLLHILAKAKVRGITYIEWEGLSVLLLLIVCPSSIGHLLSQGAVI